MTVQPPHDEGRARPPRLPEPQRRRRIDDDDVLSRYNARMLLPVTDMALPGQQIRPSAYICDRLIVRDDPAAPRSRDILGRAAAEQGLTLRTLATRAPERDGRPSRTAGNVLRLEADGWRATAPDAWKVLQS